MIANTLVLPYELRLLFRCDMFQDLVYWKLLQTVFLSKANNVVLHFFHGVLMKLSRFNLVGSPRKSYMILLISTRKTLKLNQMPSILNFGPGEWLFVKFLCLTPKLYAGAIFFRLSCICGFPELLILHFVIMNFFSITSCKLSHIYNDHQCCKNSA